MRTDIVRVCFDAAVNLPKKQLDALVVGAGVIGLVTALRLRQQGMHVEVWTRDDPFETTSAVAGAIWYPFLAEPRDRVAEWSAFTFSRLVELASESAAGVSMQSVVEVFDQDDPDLWWASAVPDLEWLPQDQVPNGYRSAVRTSVPVCDVPVHMRWLLDQLQAQGVLIVQRKLTALDEALAEAKYVVNCTGLGSRELCGDQELQPVRGQVLRVDGPRPPHAWIDDTSGEPCYLIPRSDGLVIGGTAQAGDDRTYADAGDTDAILRRAISRFPELQQSKILDACVGLRPCRSSVRLELEHRDGARRLVHNYGHGGSGYTLSWGCAEVVASLLTS